MKLDIDLSESKSYTPEKVKFPWALGAASIGLVLLLMFIGYMLSTAA